MIYFLFLLGIIGSGIVAGIYLQMGSLAKGKMTSDASTLPKTDVGLVLGTSKFNQYGGENWFYTYRIKAAIELYQAGRIKKIIVSGDNGTSSYDEATMMRNDLIAAGIPEDDVVPDYAGFRTLDSVYRSKSVFGQDEIIIISQRFHLERALYIADDLNIEARGFIAKDPLHKASYQKVIAREVLARTKAWLDCHILNTQPKYPGPYEPIMV